VRVRGVYSPEKFVDPRYEFQSISDDTRMSVIHRFCDHKMLEVLHFNALWVSKRCICGLSNMHLMPNNIIILSQ
jgi:hypothetical protein